MDNPEEGGGIISARSIRSHRARHVTATIESTMAELNSDETKYMRELRTLVDGVVPVLLSAVLSKSESAVAAGLFGKGVSPTDPTATRPIVDMGIALERLKSSHKRIPLANSDSLLTWASNAQRIYSDYVKCWRMGFQDVVVNLAPLEEKSKLRGDDSSKESEEWDAGLEKNTEGDIIRSDGGRVDVAFLLKRPLVRLKYLAKTFKVNLNMLTCVHSYVLTLAGNQHPQTIFPSRKHHHKVPISGRRGSKTVVRRAISARRPSCSSD